MDQEPIRVALRLDPHSEAISGELRLGRGAAHPFYGWLELISALDTMYGRGCRQPDPIRADGSGASVEAG